MERRHIGWDIHVLVSDLLEERGFLAAFTERTGGVSATPYASLNLGFRTGDLAERVLENRRRVIGRLGVPEFAAGRQVHGARVVRVGRGRAGSGFRGPSGFEADCLAVTRRRVPVAVLAADCVPLALGSSSDGLLVAVHAGWRGLATGVVERAVGLLDRPASAVAAIGPAIGPCHYEVGEEVVRSVAEGSGGHAVVHRRDGRAYLDLAETAAGVLGAAGIRRIDRAALCTACDGSRFYSHRRDGSTGRQAMVAMKL